MIESNVNANRYRLTFFDFKNDFPGKHFFSGKKIGYYNREQVLKVSGWVLPKEIQDKKLKLEVINNGVQIDLIDIDFIESKDVEQAFPQLKNTKYSRYKINLDLNFMLKDEYVIRLFLYDGDKVICRVWDIALIRDKMFLSPIFVLGSPRAGTTAVGNALRIALGAKNYGEHHFLWLSKKLEDTVQDFFENYHTRNDTGTFINHISPALIVGKISQQTKELYNSWHAGDYFVDKTPGRNMIKSVNTIRLIWPEAVFIFCKRRAYENVKSRLVKFPHLTLEQHSQQWVDTMSEWRNIRGIIPDNQYIELDQNELKSNDNILLEKLTNVLSQHQSESFCKHIKEISPQKTVYDEDSLNFDYNTVKSIAQKEMLLWDYSCEPTGYFNE